MISYDLWMHLTRSSIKPRSSSLKTLDTALKTYEAAQNPTNLTQLKLAFEAWAGSKVKPQSSSYVSLDESSGSSSRRNGKSRVVDLLESQLFDKAEVPEDEAAARQAIVESQEKRMTELFLGGKLVLKGMMSKISLGAGLASGATGVISKSGAMVSAISGLRGPTVTSTVTHAGPSLITNLITGLLEPVKQHIMGLIDSAISTIQTIIGPTLAELGTALVPYFGFISTGATMVKQWGTAIAQVYGTIESEWHRAAFREGDPIQAFDAYRTLLKEHAADAVATATFTTAKFAATGACMAVPDGGAGVATAVNAAMSLAQAIKKLTIVVFEVYRVFRANKALAAMSLTGKITPALFGAHPILGCYYLANATTSDLVHLAVGDWRGNGWMNAVEAIVAKDIEPTLNTCRSLMGASWFTVDVLAQSKGSYQTDWVSTKKRGLTKYASAAAQAVLNLPGDLRARYEGFEKLDEVDDTYDGFGRQEAAS